MITQHGCYNNTIITKIYSQYQTMQSQNRDIIHMSEIRGKLFSSDSRTGSELHTKFVSYIHTNIWYITDSDGPIKAGLHEINHEHCEIVKLIKSEDGIVEFKNLSNKDIHEYINMTLIFDAVFTETGDDSFELDKNEAIVIRGIESDSDDIFF